MGVLNTIGVGFRKVFGSRNDRLLKAYRLQVEGINALEEPYRGDYDKRFAEAIAKLPADLPEDELETEHQKVRVELSQELRDPVDELKKRLADGEPVESVLLDAFTILREASRRAKNHRHFDCQLVGGQVLFESKIAEMKTGEGKTIVCHLAAFLKCLQGLHVHIITVNDYLVQRDAEFAMPIFELLGFTVGYIQSQVDPGGREGLRATAYGSNITYGTNNEFGFDYLRDNMKTSLEEQVQGPLHYSVIDEVDSILIDEARTPLIISGAAEDDVTRYRTADDVARVLMSKQSPATAQTAQRIKSWGDKPPEHLAANQKFPGALQKFKVDPNWLTEDEAEALGHTQYYVVAKERKQVNITHEGVTVAQEQLGVGSLFVGANMEWPHLIENSVRAHIVYENDVDYVVKDGDIIIVDSFTGRLMHGRQWSDGLHQAVEAKEGVKVKEETQTLATITLQNFFKLYNKIAGMTGTAMTEADEFMKIYQLDVVSIPTNRPVNRIDFHDRIYKSVDDKYNAIVEEIHDVYSKGRPSDPYLLEPVLRHLRAIQIKNGESTDKIDEALREFVSNKENEGTGRLMPEAYDDAVGDMARGRPVLVGTISIENSEKLSNLLTRKYGIDHEVLNAKQHAREADIVLKAGETHIATRGKNKEKVGNVTIATNMAGRGTDIKLEQGVVYEKCIGDLGPPDGADERKFTWKEKGVTGTKCCICCPDYDAKTQCAHCWKPKLDSRFPDLGRKICPLIVPCGLHIVGTERHESRRIDNQLRGRSGRQGDPGSSRFFLSLGDDLLRMFMGEWTLKMLERMGFQEGMAIEAKSINKGIERAQKKVEEKNFGIRKHLLDYDEVMDHQRKTFYTQRQQILEAAKPGRSDSLVKLIWQMIDDTLDTSADKFLIAPFGAKCVCDWVRAELECGIEPRNVDVNDVLATSRFIRSSAKEEATNQITMQVGEYMDPDLDPKQWDIRGLARWGEMRFGSKLTQNQLRNMGIDEVQQHFTESSDQRVDDFDLKPIERFLDPLAGQKAIVYWASQKFGIALKLEDYIDLPNEEIVDQLRKNIRAAYKEREVNYPVEWILERTVHEDRIPDIYAAEQLVAWANLKFNLEWKVEEVQARPVSEIVPELFKLNRQYVREGELDGEIDKAVSHAAGSDNGQLCEWGKNRFGPAFNQEVFDETEDPREALLIFGQDLLRRELTALERYVLLQIYDQAWKEHMHAIDLLKESIGLRGFAEQDPKIAYKREGFQMFQEMMDIIKDKVTSIIFRARLSGDADYQSRYNIGAVGHADATNQGFVAGSQQTARDRDSAMRAQGEQKIETIRREQPKVGRNAPCPCGSGKKYKQCCGKK